MKKKKNKMELKGSEGSIISPESAAVLANSYRQLYGETEEFTQSEIIGIDVINQILSVNPVGIKVENGFDGSQTGITLIPVDKYGKNILIPQAQGLKDGGKGGGGSGGIKCPTVCS